MGGHQIAAAVEAALDSGADTVLVIGVLHARSDELQAARARVTEGGDPAVEASRGIQGPDLPGREDWRREFSLDHFRFLWDHALERRGGRPGPRRILRFPWLAGGHPERLPGIEELEALTRTTGATTGLGRRTVVLATGDLFHHGRAYGEPAGTSLPAEAGGLDAARASIERGLRLLEAGDHPGYNRHSALARSDARDVGQVLRHLLGPVRGRILDLTFEDMTGPYGADPPSWVAGALVVFHQIRLAGGLPTADNPLEP